MSTILIILYHILISVAIRINIFYNKIEVIILRKDLKNRIPIGSAVDKNLYEKLKELSNNTKVPMSKLLDEAIELLLDSKKAR